MRSITRPSSVLLASIVLAVGASAAAAQTGGNIRGVVTEADTKNAVQGAQVVVTGTKLGSVTRNDGAYAVSGVPAGTYTLRVARIGFVPQTRTVTVTTGGTVTEDFALAHTAQRLDEVVTTATGQAERKAVSNVVANVSVDSVRQISPANDVPNMLQARVPGLYVQTASGITGGGPAIRIRGVSSLSLSNEPLVIVDGARVDAGAVPGNLQSYGMSRFADFTGDDIESIDVIKGPSAAALYGTAAGAGVIVVKTKRGQAGRMNWRVWGEDGSVQQNVKYDANYYSWSHTAAPGKPAQCTVVNAALGKCTVDSVTSFNPMDNPDTRPFHNESRWKTGAQATGGVGSVSYYVMGEAYNETGPYQMPAQEATRIIGIRGTAPTEEEIHPNALKQYNMRGNFSVPLGDNANFTSQTGYLDRSNRQPFGDGAGYFAGLTLQMVTAPGYKTAFNGNANQFTGDIFGLVTQLSEQRLTSSENLNWAPVPWLSARATVGIDQANQFSSSLQQNGQGPQGGWGNAVGQNGGKNVNRSNFTKYSTDLGATATWHYRPTMTFKTSAGAQYFRDQQYYTAGQAYDLSVGATQLGAGARQTVQENTNENATYGAYLQEDYSWRDKVFVKAGARSDKNSAFGFQQGTVVYPNAGVSWVLSDESFFPKTMLVNSLRLRSSFGKAGVQPGATAAIPYFRAAIGPVNGVNTPYIVLSYLGNPNLKPEVTTETEYGFDARVLNHLNIEATYFNKQSHDAIINAPIPYAAYAGSTVQENIGQVQNKGVELSIDSDLLTTTPLSWNVHLSGSDITNKIVSMGGVPITLIQGQTNAPGNPVYGWYAYPITSYSDADKNGVLTPNEVTVGSTVTYRGPAIPPKNLSLSNTFRLFNRVNVSALMDYLGGGYSAWNMERDRCSGTQNCVAVNVPGASLERQAAAVAVTTGPYNSQWGYQVKNDFIKFRELSVTYELPARVAQRLGARSAQFVFSGRNLGVVWTKYPGTDPETSYYGAGSVQGNNEWFSPPATRYFIGRINLGL